MQSITIYKAGTYRELETVIQSRLGAPFNNIILKKICIIQARSGIEKKMDAYEDTISDYFSEEPKAEHFHITVYLCQNNFLYYVIAKYFANFIL